MVFHIFFCISYHNMKKLWLEIKICIVRTKLCIRYRQAIPCINYRDSITRQWRNWSLEIRESIHIISRSGCSYLSARERDMCRRRIREAETRAEEQETLEAEQETPEAGIWAAAQAAWAETWEEEQEMPEAATRPNPSVRIPSSVSTRICALHG